ncbi:MAG: 8-oxoguanine deaminase [Frankiales bacterium]|nr:8-oxoguanine deaminase [Frankiales bacterium]
MADLVVGGATLLATMDRTDRELAGGWVSVKDGRIAATGVGPEPPALRRVDAAGCLVTPGLVNTHHHMWQNLTRSFAPMTSTDFLGWLGTLYPIWAGVTAEDVYLSTRVALAELALGGCTTTADHLYLQRPGTESLLDAQVVAAQESSLRLHATRGSVDRGQRDGSPMPDEMLEARDDILTDSVRLVAAHHDRSWESKLRIALGPHSVFGATSGLMRDVATLAEQLDVRLHTHLSGDRADDAYSLGLHGMRPVDWFESVGFMSSRTWVAHAFFPDPAEIVRLGTAGVGVAHCATAGLMMSVGIAPVAELLAAGVPVGVGVDGSSNGDASSMWMEARMALVANRFRSGPAAFAARDVLAMATRNGAACLGRTGEIGELSVGANADIAVWPVEGLRWAGAVSDPVEAWLRCGPSSPKHLLVGGELVVSDFALCGGDLAGLDDVLLRHERASRRLQSC